MSKKGSESEKVPRPSNKGKETTNDEKGKYKIDMK